MRLNLISSSYSCDCMKAMKVEEFYPLVSEAIRRAETLEDLGAPGASSAYHDVSLLEEKVAEILPASDPEGALARRGAVRAALAAKQPARAQQLSERFLAEVEEDEELLRLSEQAEHLGARRPRVAGRTEPLLTSGDLPGELDDRLRQVLDQQPDRSLRDIAIEALAEWLDRHPKTARA